MSGQLPEGRRSIRQQQGIATLFTAIVLLALVTLVTVFASRVLVFEQAASGNQMRASQAFEAAQHGVELGVAWLQARSADGTIDNWSATRSPPCRENNSPPTGGVFSVYSIDWSPLQPDPDTGTPRRSISPNGLCNAGFPAPFAVQMGNLGYDVTVEFIQDISRLSDLAFVRVVARARAQDVGRFDTERGAEARVEQIVSVPGGPAGTGGRADSPIIVKTCMSNITGTPDICPANVKPGAEVMNQAWAGSCATNSDTSVETGVAVTSVAGDSNLTLEQCIPIGSNNKHIDAHGGDRVVLNPPGSSVWEELFGTVLTPSMVEILASAGVPGFVFYRDQSLNSIPPQGTAQQPVLIYVHHTATHSNGGCPKLAPGNYHALIYYESGTDCDLHGGGRTDITGTIAVEGSLTKFNANTVVRHSAFTGQWQRDVAEGASVFARVPGSWRDFQ